MGSYTVNTEASNGDIRVDMEARKDNKNAATISVHKLRYTVDVKAKKGACGGTVEKHILNDITGIFKPGMNAILGPTGSGKTSLLDVIAGRKDPHGLSGTLLVDGHRQPDNFKCMTGYVVQDDVVMGTLTVRENFMFSANLRLPEHVSHEEKKRLVDEIIVELGLTHVADSKVGTEFIRGISGGERKRTNIGMELITSPPVLFLDEPTTGLDASTANAVMILLKRLARRGRTIIFSIHQPRYAIFKLFDNMMLLAQGRTVYHGPANQALDYFSSIGYECEEHNNPPDFFLDVINGDSSSVQAALAIERAMNSATPGPSDSTSVRDSAEASRSYGTFEDTAPEKKEFIDQEGKEFSSKVTITTQEKEGHFAEILAENYRNSDSYSEIKKLVDPIEDAFFNEGGIDVAVKSGQYAASFCTQLNYVCRRSILNILRNPQTSFVQMFIVIVFAVIVGIIYLRLDIYMPAAIQNRIGALFFIIMNQVFSNLSAVELFIKERAIFIHENASGFYRVSSFFVAKVLCDIVPLRAIPLSLFCVVAYFMVGLQPDVTKFFIFYLNLFLTTFAACGIAFLLSAAFRIFAIANLMIALCFVISMVFSGLLVNLQTMGSWLSWIQYLSIFRYALNALAINELKDMVFCTQIPTDNTTFTVCDNTTGNAYLESQGIEYKTPWDLWVNTMALALIGLAFMVFAWLRLIFIKKLK